MRYTKYLVYPNLQKNREMFIFSHSDCSFCMTQKEVLRGVPGILRPFKEFIEAKGLKKGDQIVYYGVPGTCTPFIELLGFAMVDESKARKVAAVPDVGMQVGQASGPLKPKAIVVMGGLSMPNVPIQAVQVKAVIDRH
jgi:hypothetical protein